MICDLTGYNPMWMVESGVVAAWKAADQVILVRDRAAAGTTSPFDITPMRYFEYERSSFAGIKDFQQKLGGSSSRRHSSTSPMVPPLNISSIPDDYAQDFSSHSDDLSIVTAPFAHRRLKDGVLEFGFNLGFLPFVGDHWPRAFL